MALGHEFDSLRGAVSRPTVSDQLGAVWTRFGTNFDRFSVNLRLTMALGHEFDSLKGAVSTPTVSDQFGAVWTRFGPIL